MVKQEQIDKIAQWMGWQKRTTPLSTVWWWADKDHDHITGALFDPFTNPSDCARVMDGVDNYEAKKRWGVGFFASVQMQGHVCQGNGATEVEAKMNAVLALLEAIGKE